MQSFCLDSLEIAIKNIVIMYFGHNVLFKMNKILKINTSVFYFTNISSYELEMKIADVYY